MSDFSSYEKMPSSVKKIGLSESDYAKVDKLQWVVTEKVHGANFSFIYENQQLQYAKRKELLNWDSDFFGFQLIVNRLENNIIQLFEELNKNFNAPKFIIYGELFGGKYPHPEVAPIEHLNAIQTGVYYAADIHFCAFDIAIVNDQEEKNYLDYETAVSLFKKHDILFAKPLFIGKFNDCLEFNTRINSTIPAELNLAQLDQNLIEGIVVKPYHAIEKVGLKTRPIVKVKNKEFEEEKKFHQAEKWSYIPSVSSKTEDLSYIFDEIKNYITHNRLESAISKIGHLDFNDAKRIEEIQKELLHDTVTDFNENNEGLLNELEQEEQLWLKDRVLSAISQLVYSQKTV